MSIQAPNILLLGPTGSGKTHAIRTLVDAGIETFLLATEPGFRSVLGDIPSDKLHWSYIAPSSQGWDTMIDNARKVNTMSFEALSKLGNMNKSAYDEFLRVLNVCNDFVDDRTGESFGDVSSWDHNRAFVVDSLSGLNLMAMNAVIGAKPTKSMADWGVAMDLLERLIIKLTTDTSCWFVLTGHIEREMDEISGGIQLMVSTLGKKLAPRIPRFFDEVVCATRDGNKFSWSTAQANVDLKARNLPIADNIEPSFKLIKDSWSERNASELETSAAA